MDWDRPPRVALAVTFGSLFVSLVVSGVVTAVLFDRPAEPGSLPRLVQVVVFFGTFSGLFWLDYRRRR